MSTKEDLITQTKHGIDYESWEPIIASVVEQSNSYRSIRRSTCEILGYVQILFETEVAGDLHIWSIHLESGRRASPSHSHSHTTEGFYVVAGSVQLWSGVECKSVNTGNIIVFPPGGPPRHVLNTATESAILLGFAVRDERDNVTFDPSDAT